MPYLATVFSVTVGDNFKISLRLIVDFGYVRRVGNNGNRLLGRLSFFESNFVKISIGQKNSQVSRSVTSTVINKEKGYSWLL